MRGKVSLGGVILIIIGVLLLLNSLHIHVSSFIAPLILLSTGIWLIYRRRSREHAGAHFQYTVHSGTADPGVFHGATTNAPTGPDPAVFDQTWTATPPHLEGSKVKYSKFIGDMYIDCNNISLQNAEVSMFVGDLQVNLRGAKLETGLNRLIISSFVGDVQIFVPQAMAVYVHCSGFAGDVDVLGKRTSGFGNNFDSQTDNYASSESKLYIATNNFIGDIRVYQV